PYGFILNYSFYYKHTPTSEIYTLSLHDALPISPPGPDTSPRGSPEHARRCSESIRAPVQQKNDGWLSGCQDRLHQVVLVARLTRSEEHTSELQSLAYLVCRLLLEKKKTRRETQP